MNLREWLHVVISENDQVTRNAFADWIADECPDLECCIPYLLETARFTIYMRRVTGKRALSSFEIVPSVKGLSVPCSSWSLTWDAVIQELQSRELTTRDPLSIKNLFEFERVFVSTPWKTDNSYFEFYSTEHSVCGSHVAAWNFMLIPRLISYLMYAIALPHDANIERPLPVKN